MILLEVLNKIDNEEGIVIVTKGLNYKYGYEDEPLIPPGKDDPVMYWHLNEAFLQGYYNYKVVNISVDHDAECLQITIERP